MTILLALKCVALLGRCRHAQRHERCSVLGEFTADMNFISFHRELLKH